MTFLFFSVHSYTATPYTVKRHLPGGYAGYDDFLAQVD